MTDVLTIDAIRIDTEIVIDAGEIVIVELEAAAEATRYHCLFVRGEDGQWWVTVENLQIALPLLPTLAQWHWSYIQSKLHDNGRTSMALTLLMQYVHDLVT